MKQVLTVDTDKKYNIIITDDSFSKLMEELNSFTFGQKRLFVVSKKVYSLYKNILELYNYDVFVLNDGEKEKNFKNYAKILSFAQKINLTRKDVIISLGGGVVGDLAGFVASTYMRGIDYIQIPTTLLSMVDSSVGGKTAIDFNGIKNLVGTFYQPKQVFININFLKTLDKKQFMSGIGEVLKYAFIENNCGYKHSLFFYEYLTLCCEKLLDKEPMTLIRVIEYCLNLKITVVSQDEKEQGLRKILNFGHTLAHVLESLGGYKKITHGEAVVQGMLFMFNWVYEQGLIPYSYYRLSVELITKYGFKTQKLKYSSDKILEVIKNDKKGEQDFLTIIIPTEKKSVKEKRITYEEVSDMISFFLTT